MKEKNETEETIHNNSSSVLETVKKNENVENEKQNHKKIKIKKRVRKNKSVSNKISQTSVFLEPTFSAENEHKLNSFERFKVKKRVRKSLHSVQSFSDYRVASDFIDKERSCPFPLPSKKNSLDGGTVLPKPYYERNPNIHPILISSNHIRKSLSESVLDRDKKRIRFNESNSYHPIFRKHHISRHVEGTKQPALPSIVETSREHTDGSNLQRRPSKGSRKIKVKKKRLVRKKSKTSTNDQPVKTSEYSNDINTKTQKNVGIFEENDIKSNISLSSREDNVKENESFYNKVTLNEDINLQLSLQPNRLDEEIKTKLFPIKGKSLDKQTSSSTSEVSTVYRVNELETDINNKEKNLISNENPLIIYQYEDTQTNDNQNLLEKEQVNDKLSKKLKDKDNDINLVPETKLKQIENEKNNLNFKTKEYDNKTNFNENFEENESFISTKLKQTHNSKEKSVHNTKQKDKISINKSISEISIKYIKNNELNLIDGCKDFKIPNTLKSKKENKPTPTDVEPNKETAINIKNKNTNDFKKVNQDLSGLTNKFSIKIKKYCKKKDNLMENNSQKKIIDGMLNTSNKEVFSEKKNSEQNSLESSISNNYATTFLFNSYLKQIKSKLIKIDAKVKKIEIDIDSLKNETQLDKNYSNSTYSFKYCDNKEIQLLKYSFLFSHQKNKMNEENKKNKVEQNHLKLKENLDKMSSNSLLSNKFEKSPKQILTNLLKNSTQKFPCWSLKVLDKKTPAKLPSFDDSYIEYYRTFKLKKPYLKQVSSDSSFVTTASSSDKLKLFIC